jgi:tetratricopeptide (TPR) repeat protein
MDRQQKNNWDQRIFELASAYEREELNLLLDPETYQQLIDYYEVGEQFEKALSMAELAASHYRFTVDFNTRQAQILLQINRYPEALNVLERALAISPGDIELSLLKAETHICMGEYAKGFAILALSKREAKGEYLSEVLLLEALAFERCSNFERMFYALKAALKANPENELALDRISLCMEVCRKYDEGIVLYKWLLDQNPYASSVWYFLAHAYAYLGQSSAAIEAYEYAFLAEPDFEEAYQEFVDICIEEKRFREAIDVLQEISERFDTDSDLLLRTGTCFNGLEQYDTARKYLREAARLDVHNEEVYYQLGIGYAAQQNWIKANAYYRKATRMSPNFEVYQRALAESAFSLEDYKVAETAYRKALTLAPDDQQNWLNLAWFLMEMRRADEALELLEEAKEDSLQEGELSYSYCACLFANGKRQEGLRYLSGLLDESYEGYSWLFEWQPLLRSDNEVNALLSLYRP